MLTWSALTRGTERPVSMLYCSMTPLSFFAPYLESYMMTKWFALTIFYKQYIQIVLIVTWVCQGHDSLAN